MSRIADNPIPIPKGVQVTLTKQHIVIKSDKGNLERHVHPLVMVVQEDNKLVFSANLKKDKADIIVGTERALVNNMIIGLTDGFTKQLELKGVGYKAQVKGKTLALSLGFSHPVNFPIPEGVSIETPSQVEVIVKGVDKQQVGQVAANIRAYRPPEPYKGKGVRYKDERVVMKEGKKK